MRRKFRVIRSLLKTPFNALGASSRDKSSPRELDQRTAHAASNVSLHDHHNIEVKTVSELSAAPSMVETDVFLFLPKSFELPSYGKQELTRDFRSRIRVALPVDGDQGAAAFAESLTQLTARLQMLEGVAAAGDSTGDLNHAIFAELLDAAKDVAAVLSETLKHRMAEHSRAVLMSHSLLTTSHATQVGMERLRDDISDTAKIMEEFRRAIASQSSSAGAILTFLDEYMSQIYVQYLGALRTELDKVTAPKSNESDFSYRMIRQKLETLLESLTENETQHRHKIGVFARNHDSDLEREQRLVRLSHLKKFFQSSTFIDVTRQQAAAKVTESTATFATAMAAAVAAAIEFYGRTAFGSVAVQGLLVLCFGIAVYVLRDRLKDRTKVIFQNKALEYFPDFEQTLIAGERRIGKVREWFNILKSKDVPDEIRTLRQSAGISELEKHLPEDVFHCRKLQEVDAAQLLESGRLVYKRALYENTRINLERHLKFMDDAFKDLTDLDPNGQFLLTRSHRVYYFYLCVKTATGPLDQSLTRKFRSLKNRQALRQVRGSQTLLYRIVLDKHGVVRIENIET